MDMKSYLDGRIRIYLGDAGEVLKETDEVASLVTDPPYNIGYNYSRYKDNLDWQEYFSWQSSLLIGLKPRLVPNGNLLWLNYPEAAAVMWNTLLDHYVPVEWLTWVYHQHTGGKPLRKGTRAWIWFANSEQPYMDEEPLKGEYRNPTDKRIRQNIAAGKRPRDMDWWLYEQVKNVSKEKTAHPCQIPAVMTSRLVKASCPEDGKVLDLFMGSGTTAEACVLAGRRYVGAELDPKYFAISAERIEKALESLSRDQVPRGHEQQLGTPPVPEVR